MPCGTSLSAVPGQTTIPWQQHPPGLRERQGRKAVQGRSASSPFQGPYTRLGNPQAMHYRKPQSLERPLGTVSHCNGRHENPLDVESLSPGDPLDDGSRQAPSISHRILTALSSAARRVCKYICQQLLPEMAHPASVSSWFAKESWTNAGPALVLHAALAVWCNFNEMRRLLRSLESFGAILVCQSTLPKPRDWYSSHEAQSHGIVTVMPVDSA